MRTSEMPGESPKIPWTRKYQVAFFDWLRKLEGRWATFHTRSRGKPAFRDKWGCPYWLWVNHDEEGGWSQWLLSSYRKLPIGLVELVWDESSQLTLVNIIIPESRDRERGLGSILLQRVIAFGRERGMQKIVGEIVPEHEENREKLYRWYRSHGFSISLQPNRQGALTDHLIMELQQDSENNSTIESNQSA
jgi:hypothetical protein